MQLESLFLDFCFFSFWFVLLLSLSSVSLSFFSFVLSWEEKWVTQEKKWCRSLWLWFPPFLFFFFSSSHRFALSLILFLIFSDFFARFCASRVSLSLIRVTCHPQPFLLHFSFFYFCTFLCFCVVFSVILFSRHFPLFFCLCIPFVSVTSVGKSEKETRTVWVERWKQMSRSWSRQKTEGETDTKRSQDEESSSSSISLVKTQVP